MSRTWPAKHRLPENLRAERHAGFLYYASSDISIFAQKYYEQAHSIWTNIFHCPWKSRHLPIIPPSVSPAFFRIADCLSERCKPSCFSNIYQCSGSRLRVRCDNKHSSEAGRMTPAEKSFPFVQIRQAKKSVSPPIHVFSSTNA